MGAPPAVHGAGLGAPPPMPGLPPPPTGIGAMPTGDPSTNSRAAADQAILALREASSHYPSLKPMLDATIDGLKQAATAGSDAPKAPPTAPSIPGGPEPATTDLSESGGPGPM
jgi:hypothetical protein